MVLTTNSMLISLFLALVTSVSHLNGQADLSSRRSSKVEVEVNLINPMPIKADNASCKYKEVGKNLSELTTCSLTFWTSAAQYELRDFDVAGKQSGKIIRVSEFRDPFDNGFWTDPGVIDYNYMNPSKRQVRHQFSINTTMSFAKCQAETMNNDLKLCIRENSIYACPQDIKGKGRNCDVYGHPVRPIFMQAADRFSTYSTAITAAAMVDRPNMRHHFDLILFDDTGRISISLWNYTITTLALLTWVNDKDKSRTKLLNMDSIVNPHFHSLSDTDNPRSTIDQWIDKTYFMDKQIDNVRKFLTTNYGRKLKRSHTQAIALLAQYEKGFTQKSALDFPHGSLCFASGYTGFFSDYQASCKMDRIEEGMEGVFAYHIDYNAKTNRLFSHVVFGFDGKHRYRFCPLRRQAGEECLTQIIQTPPNDITTYRDQACAKTIAFYDLTYTIHEPGTSIFNLSSTPGILKEPLPFYIMAALAVNQTFYFFTGTNMLHIRMGFLERCQELSFSNEEEVHYAEDLLVPNNFKLSDKLTRESFKPYLVDYREFVSGADDARPSFKDWRDVNKTETKPKGASGGTNLAAIIIALLLGLIILAGIIYIYCLRSTVEEDIRQGKSPKSPKSSKRVAGVAAVGAPGALATTPVVPVESLHMDTVRSGMIDTKSSIKPTKSAKSVKSIKSMGQLKKTTRSPTLSPAKNKKSFTKTKSVKSAKSAGAPRQRSPKSPGTAPKSLAAKTKG